MKLKRLFSMLAAAGICLANVPLMPVTLPAAVLTVTAADTSGKCGENVTWELKDGVLTVSGTGAMEDYSTPTSSPFAGLEFSKAVVSDGVTSIGDMAFSSCAKMESITISDSVTRIGHGAFWACIILPDVIIPDGVTEIGDEAFHYCYKLTSVTIPPSVTKIGQRLFIACNEVTVKGYTNSLIEQYTSDYSIPFESIGETDPVELPRICGVNVTWDVADGVLTISGNGAMNNYTVGGNVPYADEDFTKAVLSDGVTTVGSYAFQLEKAMTAVTIPESVTKIGEGAFYFCSGLTNITIPDSVTSIGSYAFQYCRGLTSITIPDSITSIKEGTFRGCSALTELTIPGSVTEIGADAFKDCCELKRITIPQSVTSIVPNAFDGCERVMIAGYSGSYAETYAEMNNIPFEAIDAAVLRDFSGDGKTDIKDAVLLSRFITQDTDGMDDKTVTLMNQNADVNGDGVITILDIVLLLRSLAE